MFFHFPIACIRRSNSADSCTLQITGSGQLFMLVSNVREQDLEGSGRVFYLSAWQKI